MSYLIELHGYEFVGKINKKDSIFLARGTSTYPQNNADNMAAYLSRNGEVVEKAGEV